MIRTLLGLISSLREENNNKTSKHRPWSKERHELSTPMGKNLEGRQREAMRAPCWSLAIFQTKGEEDNTRVLHQRWVADWWVCKDSRIQYLPSTTRWNWSRPVRLSWSRESPPQEIFRNTVIYRKFPTLPDNYFSFLHVAFSSLFMSMRSILLLLGSNYPSYTCYLKTNKQT